MVGDQETVFCWVVVFLRLAQCRLIFFCCLMLCGLLVLVSFLFLCLFASSNLLLHLKRACGSMCTSLKSVGDSDVYVGSNWVGMDPKCGAFKMLGTCSRRIHRMKIFHLVHVTHGQPQMALELFQQIYNRKVFCGILLLLDHLQWWVETWKKVNEHQSCQHLHISWSHSSSLCQSCCSLSGTILTGSELWQKSLFWSFALVDLCTNRNAI